MKVPDDATIIRCHDEWLTYELPAGDRTSKTGLGQVQKWFLLETTRPDLVIEVSTCTDREFDHYQWVSPERAVELVVDFKKPIYRAITKAFAVGNA